MQDWQEDHSQGQGLPGKPRWLSYFLIQNCRPALTGLA